MDIEDRYWLQRNEEDERYRREDSPPTPWRAIWWGIAERVKREAEWANQIAKRDALNEKYGLPAITDWWLPLSLCDCVYCEAEGCHPDGVVPTSERIS